MGLDDAAQASGHWPPFYVCVYLQLLCGLYLGWFLALSLAFLLPALLLCQRGARRAALDFLSSRWLAVGMVMLLFAGCRSSQSARMSRTKPPSPGYQWTQVRRYLPSPSQCCRHGDRGNRTRNPRTCRPM